jgi:beta-galactosidase
LFIDGNHIEDEDGVPIQTDDRQIKVSVVGFGRFRALSNADLRREQPFGGNSLKTYFGQALEVVQSTRCIGEIKI